jgi:hypothetical protein
LRVPGTRIPKDIRDFVARFLPSVEHLEAFIALQRNATKSWSAQDLSAELRIPESIAADLLEWLASDNFLDVKISNEILYRFNPATAALQASAELCAHFYLRERIAMINLVMAATLGPMHDFAEAFRLKKGGSSHG